MMLTVGMAVYDDFEGAYMTVQSLRAHHKNQVDEIIVVDNQKEPDQRVMSLCGNAGAKYVHFPEKTGTTQPRQQVFEQATSDWVMCVDSHVMFPAHVLQRLREWLEDNPQHEKDLIQGPLLLDNLHNVQTHFDEQWRAEMWGVWGLDKRGENPDNPAFEIWGQGLGVFLAKREHWLGFNPHFRGFGGEEGYIHEKYRQAGRKALCLPLLQWIHRFGRSKGVPYPLTLWNKVRNYVLGHNELGLPLDDVYKEFVESRKMTKAEWEYLVRNPIEHETHQLFDSKNDPDDALEQKFKQASNNPSDINEHCKTLRKYAEQCESVVEFGTRHGVSSVAILSARLDGRLNKFTSYDINANCPVKGLKNLGENVFEFKQGNSLQAEIEQTDMLFIDTQHTEPQVYAELTTHHEKVNRWIVLHDTVLFGEKGDQPNTRGLLYGMKLFIQENPQWFVCDHYTNNNGLTVLSRNEADRPDKPIKLWKEGPGTELKGILSELGINPSENCSCNKRANTMDDWGVAKCDENFDEIVGWLREGSGQWGWTNHLTAGFNALKSGLAFRLNPSDPYPGLVREAIRRAALKEEVEV